jgi:hypothetical protein
MLCIDLVTASSLRYVIFFVFSRHNFVLMFSLIQYFFVESVNGTDFLYLSVGHFCDFCRGFVVVSKTF